MGNQQVRLLMSVNYHSTSVMVHSPHPSGHITSEVCKKMLFLKMINIFTKQNPGANGSPQNIKKRFTYGRDSCSIDIYMENKKLLNFLYYMSEQSKKVAP